MPILRVLTLNLWGAEAPLEPRMELVLQGLRALAPDVVGLQEVRAIPGQLPNQAEALARALGYQVCHAEAMQFQGGTEGNAILSRYPIAEVVSEELPGATPTERRIVIRAALETPVGTLYCLTTHLNYRLSHGCEREQQVLAIDDLARRTPDTLPRILMGDFNATPEHDEMRFLRGLCTIGGRRTYWQDAFLRIHPDEHGYTWAWRNPYTERLEFLERDRRLDYIYVSQMRRDGRGRVHDCRVVLDEPDGDGVFASDHFGVFAEVEI